MELAYPGPAELNKSDGDALCLMEKGKPRYAGPMDIQPVDHSSTRAALLLHATPGSENAARPALPKTNHTRIDAVRVAKARIMRRNSLRKQRLAQKR